MNLILTLLALFFISSTVNAGLLVTETVARVGGDVITSREVKISAILESVLFSKNELDQAEKSIENTLKDEAVWGSAIASVLLEVVVAMEAESFDSPMVSEKDLRTAVEKAEAALINKPNWINLEVTPRELNQFIKRKIFAKNFLKFKINAMTPIITDQEVEAYYDKNRLKFGSVSYVSIKDNIRAFLGQQQLEEKLITWFEVIKRKHKVHNLKAE